MSLDNLVADRVPELLNDKSSNSRLVEKAVSSGIAVLPLPWTRAHPCQKACREQFFHFSLERCDVRWADPDGSLTVRTNYQVDCGVAISSKCVSNIEG